MKVHLMIFFLENQGQVIMQRALGEESRTGSNFCCLCHYSPLDLSFFTLKGGFWVMFFFKMGFNEIVFAYTIHHF